MPATQCKACGYVIIDSSNPCPSCGNKADQSPKQSVQPPVQSYAQPSSNSYGSSSVLSVGNVMSISFSTLLKYPLVFVGLTLLAHIPGVIIGTLSQESTAASILNTVLSLMVQGAIAYGVFEALRDKNVEFGKCLSRGTARIVPLVLGVLLFSLFIILPMIGVVVIGLVLGSFMDPRIPFIILTFAVIIYFSCKWSVFVPACVVEQLGPMESLNRSSELTNECRMKIAGLFTLLFVVTFAVEFAFGFIGGIIGIAIVTSLIQQLVSAVPIAFAQVMIAVLYYQLREVKEGVTLDQLANVFD